MFCMLQAAAVIFFLVMLSPLQGQAAIRTISVPMALDFDMLDSLAANAAFTGPEKQALLVEDADGCHTIRVSDPSFRESDGSLFLDMRIHVRYGISAGSFCLFPTSFDGFLVTRQHPVLNPETWQLRFTTLSSRLETLDRKPARLADYIWQRARHHLPELLDGITIDLGIPQTALENFLTAVLPKNKPDAVLRIVDSLRPGPIDIDKTGLSFQQQMDIPDTIFQKPAPSAPAVLSQAHKQAFISAWETWDVFVVHLIAALSSRPLTPDEQHILLDVLLRLRYAFSKELEKPDPGPDDFVRRQFIMSWKLISPVFRHHLKESGTDSMLGYLAFFSAADSLVTLDRLGPLLGLDISRQGLLQLAALLAEGKAPSLNYDSDISPDLKSALGIGQAGSGQTDWRLQKQLPYLYCLIPVTASAWADVPEKHLRQARQWLLKQDSPDAYLEKTTRLIEEQAEKKLQDTRIPGNRHAMFRRTVLATAWQESCFRQFIEAQGSISYLRSYNQTSVGIMQINERVWRGIYDQDKLRWDISYNAMTGCEILALYFTRYAMRWMKNHPDTAVDDDFLAGMTYAMYTGGPGQLEKYVHQRSSGPESSYLSDRLFREKWAWVKQGDLGQIGRCLAGRPIPFEH